MPTRRKARRGLDTERRTLLREASHAVWLRNVQRGDARRAKWTVLQAGGGAVTTGDFTFLYDEEDGGNTLVCLSRPPRRAQCFRVGFDPDEGVVNVDVSYFPRCAQGRDLPRGDGTVAMLRAIVSLTLARSDVDSYRCVTLTDNSTIEVPGADGARHRVRLMDMYFVCTGCTWYASLMPMFLRQAWDEQQFHGDREAVLHGPSWDDFLERLRAAAPRVRAAVDAAVVVEDPRLRAAPASVVLNEVRTRRTNAALFQHVDAFLAALGANSLRGKEWVMPLVNGRVPVCEAVTGACRHPRAAVVPPAALLEVSADEYAGIKAALQVQEAGASAFLVERLDP